MKTPWLYAVIGLICWVGLWLAGVAEILPEEYIQLRRCMEIAGEFMQLVFGIWAFILWYRLRRTFMHHASIKEDESSSCCYITTWKVCSYGQMGSHAAKANW